MQKETRQSKKLSQQIEIHLVNSYLSSDEDKSDGEYEDIPIKITKRIIKAKLVVDTTELKPKKKVKKIIVADNDKKQDEKEDTTELKPKKKVKKIIVADNDKNQDEKEDEKEDEIEDKNKDEKNINKCSQRSLELNEMLFKENSNKSRNEDIKNVWKNLSNYELPNYDKIVIMKSYPGHFVVRGWCSGSIRNPHWLVMDLEGNEFYIMHCEPENSYTYFSKEDYEDVINPNKNNYPTWHKEQNGYIATHSYDDKTHKIYLHQVICKKHNVKEYSTLSVDHINRNKLDNRKENLRFATQSQQNQNTDKRNRKHNAKPLPEGIKQEDLPKYVLYYSEKYGKDKQNFREWFNIEKHPKQNNKKWSTTKSGQISIINKLVLAKEKLQEFN